MGNLPSEAAEVMLDDRCRRDGSDPVVTKKCHHQQLVSNPPPIPEYADPAIPSRAND